MPQKCPIPDEIACFQQNVVYFRRVAPYRVHHHICLTICSDHMQWVMVHTCNETHSTYNESWHTYKETWHTCNQSQHIVYFRRVAPYLVYHRVRLVICVWHTHNESWHIYKKSRHALYHLFPSKIIASSISGALFYTASTIAFASSFVCDIHTMGHDINTISHDTLWMSSRISSISGALFYTASTIAFVYMTCNKSWHTYIELWYTNTMSDGTYNESWHTYNASPNIVHFRRVAFNHHICWHTIGHGTHTMRRGTRIQRVMAHMQWVMAHLQRVTESRLFSVRC